MFLLAQAADKAEKVAEKAVEAADAAGPAVSGGTVFSIMIGVLIVPYILSWLIANKLLKQKEFSGRIGTVLMVVSMSLAPFMYQLTQKDIGDCFRLGIDLAGGTNLVYEVDRKEFEKLDKDLNLSLDNMVGAIARRVNPSGTEEVTVRRVGNARIEIIVPDADQEDVAEMKARITRLGTLEFQILATADRKQDHAGWIDSAKKLPDNENRVVNADGVEVARWVDVHPDAEISIGGGESHRAESRTVTRQDGDKEIKVTQYLIATTPADEEVTGKFLIRATEERDPQSGRMEVGFAFNDRGASRFGKLTTKYQKAKDGTKHRLAILLDGVIRSAPTINEPIYGRGRIMGRFTLEEVRSLVSVLNAGALDIPLKEDPVSEFTISPTLGVDVRNAGVSAIQISALVVIAFMVIYYLKAGIIAVLCLTLNVILILGIMVFVQGTFTLPGLAGLVLTIGMAVDANVLIFERIREEMARGASSRMAIHNGFSKAFSAIIDSNLTTLIVAAILFVIGTDQVKGFAVTLFIGILTSMFSALYFGRLMFEILEQKRKLKTLNMLSFVKSPKVDFVRKQKVALAVSMLLIVVGLGTFISRGTQNLDIDFRGGTMVTFEFNEAKAQSEFRDKLEEEFGSDITLERLTKEGESQTADEGQRWRLRTVLDDVAKVEEGIAKQLPDLKRITLSMSDVTKIVTETPDKKDDEEQTVVKKSAYEGGSQLTVSVVSQNSGKTDEITTTTLVSNLVESMKGFKEPASLFTVQGVEGSGTKAKNTEVQKYSKFELRFLPSVPQEDVELAVAKTVQTINDKPLFEERTTFSEAVGKEMQIDAVMAMAFSLIAIVAYIWFRFQRVTFGLAAVAALLHDVLVVLGLVALAAQLSGVGLFQIFGFHDFKINLPMIAAFLTIVGYSLNDTIVIFDRIREVRGKNPALTPDIINTSLNQTLARTLLTSLTTFVVVFILYVAGGEGIHGFAFCLLVGVFVGTYSSIFVASPVLLWLMNREMKPASA